MLTEVRRTLRPGAALGLVTYEGDGLYEGLREAGRADRRAALALNADRVAALAPGQRADFAVAVGRRIAELPAASLHFGRPGLSVLARARG